jgi:bifunctional UDP-N-acetylglucosamine pyrophosphorylase/glucosamine-1-phosphate N-acetyltransferase
LRDLTRVHAKSAAAATVLTAKVSRPKGYGRIIRGDGGIKKIVEERDASPDELYIREVNTGTYCFDSKKLFRALQKIKPDNDQQEYYLTDVIEVLNSAGERVVAKQADDETEVLGVNSRVELADAEMILRARINESFMEKGVTLVHPPLTYIDADVEIGRDTIIYPLSFLFGKTVVGEGCHIGPSCQITDSVVEDGVMISFAVLDRVRIEKGAKIGPFSHLRPETRVGEGGKVGSFVEIKKGDIGKGSKVPHLSYIGDATIGKDVNVGAGTITCNFNGVTKNRTVIEDEAFIGSDSILIAPIKIGKGAYTGAGSIISKDVPADALGIERSEQKNIKGWAKRKLRAKKK